MNRGLAIVVVLICASVMTILAQQNRPYNVIMKDVNGTFADLKKQLDSNALPAAAEDAAKLQSMFKETEAFWTPFKTKDAIDFSKAAQSASQATEAGAKEGN